MIENSLPFEIENFARYISVAMYAEGATPRVFDHQFLQPGAFHLRMAARLNSHPADAPNAAASAESALGSGGSRFTSGITSAANNRMLRSASSYGIPR